MDHLNPVVVSMGSRVTFTFVTPASPCSAAVTSSAVAWALIAPVLTPSIATRKVPPTWFPCWTSFTVITALVPLRLLASDTTMGASPVFSGNWSLHVNPPSRVGP